MADQSGTQAPVSNHMIAYRVKEVSGNRSIFHKIGAAFPHKSGNGFNVELDAFPCDGKIVVLPPKDEQASASPEAEPPASDGQ